ETRTYKEAVLSSHRTAADGHFVKKEAASPESFEPIQADALLEDLSLLLGCYVGETYVIDQ
ncbi:hypothetical protein Ancab_022164, partial [Ancistrocladus abbreviatus]